MDLVIRVGISKTISNVGPFYPQLIREFIVNLTFEFNDPSSPDYQTVHIRVSMFKISPTIINGFLGSSVTAAFRPSEISNDVLPLVLSKETLSVWPVNGIPAISLSVK